MVQERIYPIERLARGELMQHLNQSAAAGRLGFITQRFINGEITEAVWARLMQAEIRDAGISAFLVGYEQESGQTITRLVDLPGVVQRRAVDYVNRQLRYFTNWRNDLLVRAGFDRGRIQSVLSGRDMVRGMMYGGATDGAFNKGKLSAALELDEDVLVFWRLRPAEHCNSCLALADASPFTPAALPTEPGAGDTECRANCQCYLDFMPKAEAA